MNASLRIDKVGPHSKFDFYFKWGGLRGVLSLTHLRHACIVVGVDDGLVTETGPDSDRMTSSTVVWICTRTRRTR